MDLADLLIELYDRIPDAVRGAVEGLSPAQLLERPAAEANTIGWLGWHLVRVQDHHISELLDEPQLWEAGGWAEGFDLAPDPSNTGYGHGPDEVAAVRPASAEAIVAYLDAVAERTRRYLAGLGADDLDRIVDRRWDPPVTLGVRLVSIAEDDLQHAGQAAYLRGLLTG
ncbi:MAG: DUF664 domain-containing protein [Acidimicrobiales bacterium]